MAKIGRNDSCPCGSGRKYKHCTCGLNSENKVAPKAKLSRKILKTQAEFENEIDTLRNRLTQYTLATICMSCFTTIWTLNWKEGNTRGMSSPYRQCTYIASLALEIPAALNARDIKEDEWNELCVISENIFHYYTNIYFKDENRLSGERNKTKVSMLTFLPNLGSGISITAEQARKDILDFYLPFNADIERSLGLSINSILDAADFFIKTLQSRLDNGLMKNLEAWRVYRMDCAVGIDPKEAMRRAKNKVSPDVARHMQLMGCVLPQELYDNFDQNTVEKFLAILCQERVETAAKAFLFPSEEHSIEWKPIIKENEKYFVAMSNLLYTSLVRQFEKLVMRDTVLYQKYNTHLAANLEQRTLLYLKTIIGEEAQYFQTVFETPNSQNEYDILILVNRTILIIECKAKSIRKNFRDPEKAYPRIKRDFEGYIQEAYDQATRLRKYIQANETILLYDRKGNPILKIKHADYDTIECICVTKDNEGVLATDLSVLLEKESFDPYPYCINSLELRHLAELKDHFQISASMVLRFLTERKQIQGKVLSDDEADYWGYFIQKVSFKELIEKDADLIMLELSSSQIFNDAYRAGAYIPVT